MGHSEFAAPGKPPSNLAVNGISQRARIWIDVEDFLRHYDGSLTPTGIDRVQAEIFPHLVRNHADRVVFVRLGGDGSALSLLDYDDVRRLADGDAYLSRHSGPPQIIALRRLYRFVSRRAAVRVRELRRAADHRRFEATVRPGDVLLCMSGSWERRGFGEAVHKLKQRYGMRFVALFHDLLPVTHPQFVAPRHIPNFTRWLHSLAGLVDLALTPSRSSANALADWMAQNGHVAPLIQPVPFGAGFPSTTPSRPAEQSEPREHVLYVSTIEIRKNHMLLFRVWERLIAQHGTQRVPPLVLAGKFGWEISDFKAALANTGNLLGRIVPRHDLTDAELARLYRRSYFTVFPSLCEGWGLPVAESLLFGRHCICSNATSLPEVGGSLVDYHDPSDFEAAYRLIERALFDRDFIAARERRIATQYVPPLWQDTAEAIVQLIDRQAASGHTIAATA